MFLRPNCKTADCVKKQRFGLFETHSWVNNEFDILRDPMKTERTSLELNRKRMRLAECSLPAAITVGCLWLAGCGGGSGGSGGGFSAQYKASVIRLHSVNIGLLMYSNDFDDVLPLAGKWVDGTLPYTKDDTIYRSPAVATRGYGYALNSSIPGQTLPLFNSPETIVSVFDSTDLARNATDPTTTEPSPPRYSGHNTIGYLDGHVKDYDAVTDVSLYAQSQSRLKQVDLGMLVYANDYDGVLPLANQWMDEMDPYIKRDDAIYRSPAVQLKNPTAYGYAFNQVVAGQQATELASPATTISFFDSTVLTRNATAATTTQPSPPRYGTKNTIAYTDGHVQP